ncbi:hypothetical protein [Flammeovirga sp. SJP92]|uniref:hypothetical protein n=1 Tax=Flammeovirga sp. SJP92 TaxID=1775430 RepID=UPI0007874750|nr:hypothetical protein [Flammeovirga sp. SJP92]KXX69746.1 hypothetical protein AVL50_12705 [Flammeovirga sp. SJP92]
MDQFQEFFAVLSEEQKYTLLIVVIAIALIVWRIAKTAIKLIAIAAICIIGYLAYTQFEPSGLEKAGKKAKFKIENAVK